MFTLQEIRTYLTHKAKEITDKETKIALRYWSETLKRVVSAYNTKLSTKPPYETKQRYDPASRAELPSEQATCERLCPSVRGAWGRLRREQCAHANYALAKLIKKGKNLIKILKS